MSGAAEWGHGKYGPSPGGLIASRFAELTVSPIVSPITTQRGFEARLRYLLKSDAGARALADAGVKNDRGRIVDWLTGDVQPSAKSRDRVQAAYIKVRAHNVAASLKRRLAGPDGRGTKVTVEPLDPGKLPASRGRQTQQRALDDREVMIRPEVWDDLVDAWADDDIDGMDDVWCDDVASELGSPPELWFEVSHIGFSA